MKARIIDIEGGDVAIRLANGKLISVSQDKIKFKCRADQTVFVEKNDGKIYVSSEESSFWDNDHDSGKKTSEGTDGKKIAIIILSIVCVIAPVAMFFWAKSFFYQLGYDAAVIDKEGDYGIGWNIGFEGGKKEGLNQGYADGYETGYNHAVECAKRIALNNENINVYDCWGSLRK